MHFRGWLSVVKVWKLGFLQCHYACFELRVQWLNYEAFVSCVWIVEFSFASSLLQVKEDTTLSCGKLLRIASTAFLWLRFWTRRYFAVTEVCFLSYVLNSVQSFADYELQISSWCLFGGYYNLNMYRQRQKIYKCFHGFDPGLSPDLQSMEQIRRIMRPTDVPDQGKAKCKSQCAPFMA